MTHDYSTVVKLAKNAIDEYVVSPTESKLIVLEKGLTAFVDHLKTVLSSTEAEAKAKFKAYATSPIPTNFEKGHKVVYTGPAHSKYSAGDVYTVVGRMVKSGTSVVSNVVVANKAGYNIGELTPSEHFRLATPLECAVGYVLKKAVSETTCKPTSKFEESTDTLYCAPIDSTLIKSFKWHKTFDKYTNVLEVALLTADVPYYYQGVPKHLASKWIENVKAGGSPGSFYNSHIKGIYATFTVEVPVKEAIRGYSHYERVVPNSSFIAKIQWFSEVCDGTKDVLRVDFKDGTSVLYKNVHKDVYDLWVRAIEVGSSSGVFFNMNVKDRYLVLIGTAPEYKKAPVLATKYEGTLFEKAHVDENGRELKVGDRVVYTGRSEFNLVAGDQYKIVKIEKPADTKSMKHYAGSVLHVRNSKGHSVKCVSSVAVKKA